MVGAQTVNLSDGSISGILNSGGASGFSNIDALVGDNTADSLVGNSNWTISGENDGTVDGVSFTDFPNLTGTTNSDVFTFQDSGSITGAIDGGGAGGTDSIDFSAVTTSAVTVNLESTSATNLNNFTGIESFTGDGANDTLVGGNVANTWNITGTGDGTVGSVSFTDFANLTGGTDDDTFDFGASGSLSGTIDGGGQSTKDTLGYADVTGPITVNLQTGAASLIYGGAASGFSNIEDLVGSGNSGDTLVGANTAQTWNITGADVGNIGGVMTFASFANLAGGTDDDTFDFGASGSLSGMIDGEAGSDTLDYADFSTSISVTLANDGTGTESHISGGFSNMEKLHRRFGQRHDQRSAPDFRHSDYRRWSTRRDTSGRHPGVRRPRAGRHSHFHDNYGSRLPAGDLCHDRNAQRHKYYGHGNHYWYRWARHNLTEHD